MAGYNYLVPTQVQNGESLGLYANMYGCTTEEIKKANGLKGDKIKTGQTLNIPVGQKSKLPTSDKSVLDKKLSWFNDQVNNVHMKLYDPKLKPAEREKLEDQYIKLMNMKKKRDAVATFKKAGNGINLVLEIKKDITVTEFRKLFPECTKNFYDYAYDTNQRYCDEVHGWVADPDIVTLQAGAKIMIRAEEYAKDDGDTGWSGFCRGWVKTMPSWLGGGRLDGK
ncbi:MAG: LysM peptidoglycan-binding domain-containing protein [Muribaculaceae bacterium]|nr:LysM peptidoglycan-binding domain-containing protein [Muribaculaceae bacterium]